MKNKIHEPLYTSALPEGSLDEIESRIENQVFNSGRTDRDLSSVNFHECMFRNISFRGTMNDCLFQDVTFDHCDLSNCNISESVFRRVKFNTCRMMGTDMTSSSFADVSLVNCQCAYINLNASKWKNAVISGTILCEGSLSMCTFQNTSFEHSDFSGCEFAHTPLNGLDLSTCEIDGIAVTAEDLKGVTVNAEQAVACAKLLGITVKD